jgi:predicted short-subunit dehydrogenase-like oxidoreductase (DUF2520 family)
MKGKPSVAIVGPGSLGTALALCLGEARYRIAEVVCRAEPSSTRPGKRLARKLAARVSTLQRPILAADIVWLCVPDAQIRDVAVVLSQTGQWEKKTVFHSSGALSSDELQALRRKGANVASVHPLMTFVRGVRPSLDGVPFAMEGDRPALRLARRIVRDLGGDPFLIEKQNKPAYHACGAFASPLLIATLATAEQVAHVAGIRGKAARTKMLAIVQRTIQNYADKGAAAAFSGPIIRGDADTVRKHLKVLAAVPGAKDVYVALARSALRYLPCRDRNALKRILG